jgi:hypothetical protein
MVISGIARPVAVRHCCETDFTNVSDERLTWRPDG